MLLKNRISLFVATFLIIGFFFLALPEKGFSGDTTAVPPAEFTSVPTLDVWGIIVMAVVLAIFGFLAIRRIKAKA
jgi:hypothetical protein